MSFSKPSKLALSVLLASAVTSSAAYATNTKIYIASAANFTPTLNALANTFQATYPNTIQITSDSTGNLTNDIIAGSPQFDLFYAADYAHPQNLATNHSSLVSGSPWLYAVGSLELWSQTTDISAGLPNPLNTNIVIADPTKAPYGYAASQVLASSPWNITTIPSGYVYTSPNIGTTFDAIKTPGNTYQYGFVAQSYICVQNSSGVQSFNRVAGTNYHHSYLYNDTSHPYNRITQYAIKVVDPNVNTTILNNFLNFMATTSSQNTIKTYCYQLS